MSIVASDFGAGPPGMLSLPSRRSRLRARILRAATSFLAAIGIVSVAGFAIAAFWNSKPRAPAAVAAPKSEWIDYGKPVQVFAVQTAEFGKDVRLYEARRHRDGGGRQDVLAYGAAELGHGPSLRVSFYRPGMEIVPEMTFFVDVARQAGRAGLAVKRSAQPDSLPTRFGAFEVADVILGQDSHEAACLAFRREVQEPQLKLSGFACGGARPVDRQLLACALDRIDLIVAGEDRELSRYFIGAEQGRGKACAALRGPGAKSTWLDPGVRLPALRAEAGASKTVTR